MWPRSPISATAELLLNFAVCRDPARRAGSSATADILVLSLPSSYQYLTRGASVSSNKLSHTLFHNGERTVDCVSKIEHELRQGKVT